MSDLYSLSNSQISTIEELLTEDRLRDLSFFQKFTKISTSKLLRFNQERLHQASAYVNSPSLIELTSQYDTHVNEGGPEDSVVTCDTKKFEDVVDKLIIYQNKIVISNFNQEGRLTDTSGRKQEIVISLDCWNTMALLEQGNEEFFDKRMSWWVKLENWKCLREDALQIRLSNEAKKKREEKKSTKMKKKKWEKWIKKGQKDLLMQQVVGQQTKNKESSVPTKQRQTQPTKQRQTQTIKLRRIAPKTLASIFPQPIKLRRIEPKPPASIFPQPIRLRRIAPKPPASIYPILSDSQQPVQFPELEQVVNHYKVVKPTQKQKINKILIDSQQPAQLREQDQPTQQQNTNIDSQQPAQLPELEQQVVTHIQVEQPIQEQIPNDHVQNQPEILRLSKCLQMMC